MKLTDAEKLILHNQYEVLAVLCPSQAKNYGVLRDCLSDGYEKDFDQLIPHFEPPQSSEVYNQVRAILEMFRGLTPNAGSGIAAPVAFAGFDGNEETEHFAYARFLIEDRGLWRESLPTSFNTHSPVLNDYLEMLDVWESAEDKNSLQPEELAAIVASAPYSAKNP